MQQLRNMPTCNKNKSKKRATQALARATPYCVGKWEIGMGMRLEMGKGEGMEMGRDVGMRKGNGGCSTLKFYVTFASHAETAEKCQRNKLQKLEKKESEWGRLLDRQIPREESS